MTLNSVLADEDALIRERLATGLDLPSIEPVSRKTFPVMEMFGPTIQGEGAMAGSISHFIRLGGCSYRCSWCDSMHAVEPARIKAGASYLTAYGIVDKIKGLAWAPWVTISGGDPCIWDLGELVSLLHMAGYKVAIETQGTLFRPWLTEIDLVTVSPKPPSSGMSNKTNLAVLSKYVEMLGVTDERFAPKLVFKIPVADVVDLQFALKIFQGIPRGYNVPKYLSIITSPHVPGVQTENAEILAVLEDYRRITALLLKQHTKMDIRILPQLHVLLFGNKLGV